MGHISETRNRSQRKMLITAKMKKEERSVVFICALNDIYLDEDIKLAVEQSFAIIDYKYYVLAALVFDNG
jgi:hypothetical protein